jgi:hypothetical protein
MRVTVYRRQRLTSQLLIPEFLCGRLPTVRRRCRQVIRRAIASRSLRSAVEHEPFIPIEEAPGQLVLAMPDKLVEMEHVLLSPLSNELKEATFVQDRVAWYGTLMDLYRSALDEFWFCLTMLGSHGKLMPLSGPDDRRRVRDARGILTKLIRGWPAFCELDDRFTDHLLTPATGFQWGSRVWELLREMGRPDVIFKLQKVDPEDAPELLEAAIKRGSGEENG